MTSATPANEPWQAATVVIDAITEETPGVATYDLRFEDAALERSYSFLPGQFNMLYLPGIGEAAISISRLYANENGVAHTVRLAGNVTQSLARLDRGGQLGLRGPFGTSWPLEACVGKDVVVVAGGIGLAPLRPAIDSILANRDQFGRLTVLSGARSPDDLLYRYLYPEWRRKGVVVDVTVDRSDPGWQGHVGVVPLLVDRMRLPHPDQTILLTCGPEVMMWYTVKSAMQRGIAADRIWLNMERNMNCGVGLCGHCQLGSCFVCRDGPILRYDQLAPYLLVKDL